MLWVAAQPGNMNRRKLVKPHESKHTSALLYNLPNISEVNETEFVSVSDRLTCTVRVQYFFREVTSRIKNYQRLLNSNVGSCVDQSFLGNVSFSSFLPLTIFLFILRSS